MPKEGSALFTLHVSSPVLTDKEHAIPDTYTCDGAGISPPLHWGNIPRGAAELALFVASLNPSSPGGGGESFSWAVAGLRPTLKGLSAGTLPPGAIVGRNSSGLSSYTVCPQKGSGVQPYIIVLYALRHHLATRHGFSAQSFIKRVEKASIYKGGLGFTYTRK